MGFITYTFVFIGAIFFSSCETQNKTSLSKYYEKKTSEVKITEKKEKEKTYTGWWVYGEKQHIFKDEKTLEEHDLAFPNENMKELKELYLAVCEMEYFPMECTMTGILQKSLDGTSTLVVSRFEILYIQGCGE